MKKILFALAVILSAIYLANGNNQNWSDWKTWAQNTLSSNTTAPLAEQQVLVNTNNQLEQQLQSALQKIADLQQQAEQPASLNDAELEQPIAQPENSGYMTKTERRRELARLSEAMVLKSVGY